MPLDVDGPHARRRDSLRILGPLLVVVGVVFVVVAAVDFFSSFRDFSTVRDGSEGVVFPGSDVRPAIARSVMPGRMWCAFVGAPLMALGVFLTKVAYLGAATRYVANEVAPVGRDVVNYLVEGARGAARGVAGPAAGAGTCACRSCGVANEADAAFCKGCGKPVVRSNVCAGCGEPNDLDARYCDHCGKVVG